MLFTRLDREGYIAQGCTEGDLIMRVNQSRQNFYVSKSVTAEEYLIVRIHARGKKGVEEGSVC